MKGHVRRTCLVVDARFDWFGQLHIVSLSITVMT